MRYGAIAVLAISLTIGSLTIGAVPAQAGWDEGVTAFKNKNYDAAAQEFQQVAAQQPQDFRGHYMLGLTLLQQKKSKQAIDPLRKAYELQPSNLDIQMALARAYRGAGRYADVAKLLSAVDASAVPANNRTAFYQLRGEARLKSGSEDAALADLAQLAKLESNNAQVQLLYGTTALKAGNIDAGLAAISKAAQLAPNDHDTQTAYANALLQKARRTNDKSVKTATYVKAAEVTDKLAAKNGSFENLMLATSANLGANRWDAAVAAGKKAIAKKNSDWLPYYYVGQALTSSNKFTEAEPMLRLALERAKGTDQRSVWRQIGFVAEKQKNYAAAIEAYRQAGDQGSVARVEKNQETAEYNEQVEAENDRIKRMEEEAKRLEAELKALESGGGF